MIKKFTSHFLALFFISIALINNAAAQNSLLVNFGADSCNGSGSPAFSFIKDPFGNSAYPLTNCSLARQLPDIFAVFIAYNPKNNKIYVADIRSGITKIWVLDMGLPANITCPAMIDTLPDYAYSYVSNNFEFDNNGDLWSFSNYNDTTGQCNMDKFDVTTGKVINTRLVQFPAGNFPVNITSGDLTILPNGRMFATLGANPSRLYEINNYNSTSANATATFLDSIPQNCYGIAYLNGLLEIAGSNFNGNCYYYKYNITTKVLDSAVSFQNGQLPIDNTSITPSLGVTKQLVSASKVNINTADLTYDIYVKNLGNVALNNINVADNLAAVFGAQNISNINVAFVTGENNAALILNPSYNGNTDPNLLTAVQPLANQTSVNQDYFFKLRLSFRVTNLNSAVNYLNSATGSATIGSGGTSGFINVSDSSNNGPETVADPNNNGNAGEVGENIPTPFNFTTLPVKFISIAAAFVDNTSALVQWTVATPVNNTDKFQIEYSTDGTSWNSVGSVKIINTNQSSYRLLHSNIPGGNLWYRIKEIDIDGAYVFSKIVLLRAKNASGDFIVSPNPANGYITITANNNVVNQAKIFLYDAVGKQLNAVIMSGDNKKISTSGLPDGTYILKIINSGKLITQRVLIMHR